jgi:hypothetical protein
MQRYETLYQRGCRIITNNYKLRNENTKPKHREINAPRVAAKACHTLVCIRASSRCERMLSCLFVQCRRACSGGCLHMLRILSLSSRRARSSHMVAARASTATRWLQCLFWTTFLSDCSKRRLEHDLFFIAPCCDPHGLAGDWYTRLAVNLRPGVRT